MNKIKIIFLSALLISCLSFFAGAVRADYVDYILDIGKEVHVGWVGLVDGVATFKVTVEGGKPIIVTGDIINGRGVPNLSGVTTGILANQTIKPPRTAYESPLDSSARYDEYFTKTVAPGHSLVGYTPAGQTYYTDPDAVNTLAPQAPISVQELITLAYRVGPGEISWVGAGILGGEFATDRNLTGAQVNDWLAEVGSSIKVDKELKNVTRAQIIQAIMQQQSAASANGGNGNGGNGNGGNGWDAGKVFPPPFFPPAPPPPPVFPTCSSFSSNRQRILYNQKAELQWNCANVDYCSISPDVGQVGAFGSESVYPKTITTYTLTCYRGSQATSPLTTTIEVYEIILEETGVR